MRLSEYGLMGSSLKECDPSVWLNADGTKGCFIGGAILASGLAPAYLAERKQKERFHLPPTESVVVMAKWPWLTEEIADTITHKIYFSAADTERAAAYLRSVEPAEEPLIDSTNPEPEPEHHIHEWEGEGGAVPRETKDV